MTQNQIAFRNAKETERHNKMYEQETARHNIVEEYLKSQENALKAEQNRYTEEHYQRSDAINSAHYERQDAYTKEHYERADAIALGELQVHQSSLAETQRANLASEEIRRQQNAINAAELQEARRHQMAVEDIDRSLNASTIARNFADVSYIGANADYIRKRTTSEMLNWRNISQQYSLNQSEIDWKKAQTKYKTLLDLSAIGKNAIGAGTQIANTIMPIVAGAAMGY